MKSIINAPKVDKTGVLTFTVSKDAGQFEVKIQVAGREKPGYIKFPFIADAHTPVTYDLNHHLFDDFSKMKIESMSIHCVDMLGEKITSPENGWVSVEVEPQPEIPPPIPVALSMKDRCLQWLRSFREKVTRYDWTKWLRALREWLGKHNWMKWVVPVAVTAVVGLLVYSFGVPMFNKWSKERQEAKAKALEAEQAEADKALATAQSVPTNAPTEVPVVAAASPTNTPNAVTSPANDLPTTSNITITHGSNGVITITGIPNMAGSVFAPVFNSGSSNTFGGHTVNNYTNVSPPVPVRQPEPAAGSSMQQPKYMPGMMTPLNPSSDSCTIKGCVIPPGETHVFTYPLGWKASMFTHTPAWQYRRIVDNQVVQQGVDTQVGYLMYQNNSSKDMVLNFVLELKYPEVAQKASWALSQ